MSILDRYGIKEVADVTFYSLSKAGKPEAPVLYLDTLKVSTIEQTGEMADARGGKGNPKLITWDYGKEITVTLEDALFSAKSMAIMFGNGSVKSLVADSTESKKLIMKTESFVADDTILPSKDSEGKYVDKSGWKANVIHNGQKYAKINPRFFDAEGNVVTALVKNETFFCTYDLAVTNEGVIEISGNTFPGTYYVTGDTYARNMNSGEDEFFQFIIPKAKVTSENTITLEAEGDPSVFNMNLTVLRPADGVMMKLVKYELADGEAAGDTDTAEVIHNHNLDIPSE